MNCTKKKRSHLLPLLLSMFLIIGMLAAPLSFGVEGEEPTPPQPASASEKASIAEAPPQAPDGYTTDSNNLVAYKVDDCWIDVKGLFDNRWIGSTYSDEGFFPVVRIGESVYAGSDYDLSELEEKTGLALTPKPSISPDGKAIYVKYLIKNTTTETIIFDFAIAGDVQIDEDDSATLSMMPDGRGFFMTKQSSEVLHGSQASTAAEVATLAIFISNTLGVDSADGVWLGEYDEWDYFTNQQNDVTDKDSAFSVFWLAQTLAGNETSILGMGSALGDMDAADALAPDDPAEDPVTEEPAPELTKPAPEVSKADSGKVVAKDASPKTGDSSMMHIAIIMFLALGTAIAFRETTRQD